MASVVLSSMSAACSLCRKLNSVMMMVNGQHYWWFMLQCCVSQQQLYKATAQPFLNYMNKGSAHSAQQKDARVEYSLAE